MSKVDEDLLPGLKLSICIHFYNKIKHIASLYMNLTVRMGIVMLINDAPVPVHLSSDLTHAHLDVLRMNKCGYSSRVQC